MAHDSDPAAENPLDASRWNLPFSVLQPLLLTAPDHPGLQQALTRCTAPDPVDLIRLAVGVIERARTLDPVLLDWLIAHRDATLCGAVLARADTPSDRVLAAVKATRSKAVLARALTAHPDLIGELDPGYITTKTLPEARLIVDHPAAFAADLVFAAVAKLLPRPDRTNEQVEQLTAAVNTPGVSDRVALDASMPVPWRLIALASRHTTQRVLLPLLEDGRLLATNAWSTHKGRHARALAVRPDMTPTLARALSATAFKDSPNWQSRTDVIAGWGQVCQPEHADRLATARTHDAVVAAWADVPAAQRPAAAWVVAQNPHAGTELADEVLPLLDTTPADVRATYLYLIDTVDFADLRILREHTPSRVTYLTERMKPRGSREVLHRGDDAWRQLVSGDLLNMYRAGALDVAAMATCVATPGFDANLIAEIPFPVVRRALIHHGAQLADPGPLLDAVALVAGDPDLVPALDNLAALETNETGFTDMCRAIRASAR